MVLETNIIGKPLLFVGGDLSGIQKFLYNITSKKAAVSLKGRSKYLTDYVFEIEHRIEQLPSISNGYTKKVYDSGGKFYLIVEDTEDNRQAIEIEKLNIEKELWEEHHGQLSINIGYTPFSFNNDGSVNVNGACKEPLGKLWETVNAQFAQMKTQRFKDVMDECYTQMFEPIVIDKDSKTCAITGIESPDCVLLIDEKDEPLKKGKDSKQSDANDNNELWVLPSVKKQVEIGEQLRKEEHFKTFEEYASGTFLGVLRMDVDGLGKVFITGFDNFGDYTTFSETLKEFFTKKLHGIQQSNEFRDYVNIIYAGGDDMFVVGQWDKVIDFAYEARNAFMSHVKKDGLTISGGIAIVDPKFPIAKAALLSGDAEDEAKQFRNGEKNAFNMFGKSLSWNDEFDYVRDLKNKIMDLCLNKDQPMPTSILHKIMLFALIKQQGEIKYLWNTAYYLARFKKGKSKDIMDFCDWLKRELFDSRRGSRNYELAAIAARWAEMLLKENV